MAPIREWVGVRALQTVANGVAPALKTSGMRVRHRFSIHTYIDRCHLCVYINHMRIEWDEPKRTKTLAERGLDFADVALIDWDEALTLEDARQDYQETRFVTFAQIRGRLCVIAWCYRNGALRVISMRKANKREVKRYG